MPLTDFPPDARPREKWLAGGPGVLADAELPALRLRTGLKSKNVLQRTQELPGALGGRPRLLKAGVGGLARSRGLGPAKRDEVPAVLKIALRSLVAGQQYKAALEALESLQSLQRYCQLRWGRPPREVFAAIFLDAKLRPIVMAALLTVALKSALALIEVKALDHLIVGDGEPLSFAERGLS
ncbi:MAG: hypothetical protein JO006_07490 [Paucibacter sp.]|nr:hypothetical protein [Roseateles sp.]